MQPMFAVFPINSTSFIGDDDCPRPYRWEDILWGQFVPYV